ncbi:MAG: hypothetical protein AMS15_08285 [Planctomycetes bacterium DG_23]|nr:MAG: hypothetical protein AMS15_08285 [Planctomycetes bacterium DG_23]
MDEHRFQQQIRQEAEAKRAAAQILRVDETASLQDIKRAWRKACLEHHPDHRPDDEDAHQRLIIINCAYELLAKGTPCKMLLNQRGEGGKTLKEGKYNIDNLWGYFLAWRERYF